MKKRWVDTENAETDKDAWEAWVVVLTDLHRDYMNLPAPCDQNSWCRHRKTGRWCCFAGAEVEG